MVEVNSRDKFYKLLFSDKPYDSTISIFENRVLKEDEYHKAQLYLAFWIYDVVKQEKRLFNHYTTLPIFYEDYERMKSDFYTVDNNPSLDGFRYHEASGTIYYGDTSIYIFEKFGRYYDLISGKEILETPFLNLKPVLERMDLEEMICDLRFIHEHQELYLKITSSVYWKLWKRYDNYAHANDLLEKELASLMLEKQKTVYERFVDGTLMERNRVKSLVEKIRENYKKESYSYWDS